ncbi:MAG: hypothetical protein FWH24_04735 [Oscillospiraceae bacterium]|nr:hypothetical protein [Oscillospiraceae bacterium]
MDFCNLRKDKINDNLVLYQIKNGLLFGTDALLLADFICGDSAAAYKTGVEFGAGSGVVSLLLAARGKIKLIYALEIQEIYTELAGYNVRVNDMCDKIKILCADLKNCDELYYKDAKIPPHTADVVFTNPPYIKHTTDMGNSGKLSVFEHKNIARREVACNIFDVLKSAARLLKNGGDFYAVYRPDRLQSLFSAMSEYNITPKKLRFVFSGPGSSSAPASLVLVKARQGAGEGLRADTIYLP